MSVERKVVENVRDFAQTLAPFQFSLISRADGTTVFVVI